MFIRATSNLYPTFYSGKKYYQFVKLLTLKELYYPFLLLLVHIQLPYEIKTMLSLVKIQFFCGENGVTSPGHRPGWWYMLCSTQIFMPYQKDPKGHWVLHLGTAWLQELLESCLLKVIQEIF